MFLNHETVVWLQPRVHTWKDGVLRDAGIGTLAGEEFIRFNT